MFAAKRAMTATGVSGVARKMTVRPTAVATAAWRWTSSLPSGAAPTPAPAVVHSGGSSFGQRLSSFFAGVGVASVLCGYVVYEELLEANTRFDKTLRALEKRVQAVEK